MALLRSFLILNDGGCGMLSLSTLILPSHFKIILKERKESVILTTAEKKMALKNSHLTLEESEKKLFNFFKINTREVTFLSIILFPAFVA